MRPLPYADADRIFELAPVDEESGFRLPEMYKPSALAWRDQAELFEVFDFFGSYLLEERPSAAEGAASGAACDQGLPEAPPAAGEAARAAAAAAAEDMVDDEADPDDGPPTVCDLLDAHGRATHVAHIDARGARPRSWVSALPSLGKCS